MQEPLYKDLQRLLNYKCDYFSSEQKVIDCYVGVTRVNEDEENEIKRKVSRYFGTDEYNQLCTILDLCEKANHINSDLGTLFTLIEKTDPQQYSKLSDVLRSEYVYDLTEQEHENNQKFLSTIAAPYCKFADEEPGKSYDYLKLSAELQSLNNKIKEKRKAFDKRLNAIMMKK